MHKYIIYYIYIAAASLNPDTFVQNSTGSPSRKPPPIIQSCMELLRGHIKRTKQSPSSSHARCLRRAPSPGAMSVFVMLLFLNKPWTVCTKAHTFTSTQTLLRTSEDAHSSGPVPWPGPTRRRSSGIPCLCSSALVHGRHDGAITQHGRLQRHGNVDLGRETRSGSGLEVAVDAP